MSAVSEVEMLIWEGCPSHPQALAMLRDALRELRRLDEVSIRVRQVDSDEQAQAERFVGSPTLRVDGEDLFPAADHPGYALTCRVYRLRDGRFSPTPDPADLRDALADRLGPATA